MHHSRLLLKALFHHADLNRHRAKTAQRSGKGSIISYQTMWRFLFHASIRQGSLLSPYSIYPPRPWLKGKTGVNVVLQPARPGLRFVSALKPPFFTSLIAFTPFPLVFHLQPTSMSVVCFMCPQGESWMYEVQTPVCVMSNDRQFHTGHRRSCRSQCYKAGS